MLEAVWSLHAVNFQMGTGHLIPPLDMNQEQFFKFENHKSHSLTLGRKENQIGRVVECWKVEDVNGMDFKSKLKGH